MCDVIYRNVLKKDFRQFLDKINYSFFAIITFLSLKMNKKIIIWIILKTKLST